VQIISYLSRRRDNCLATFRYIHIDVERVSIAPLREVKGVGPTVFHEKKNGQRRCTYLVLGLDIFYFIKYQPTPLTCLSVGNSCIEDRIVKCCNGIAEGENHILYLL
jgi:hypothetical protein